MGNDTLLKKEVLWKIHPDDSRYWYWVEEGRIILLRLNNFPEEPIHTLINGLDIMDMEESPSRWILKYSDKKRSVTGNSVLMEKNIFWKRHSTIRRYWYVEEDENLILLRMNDFPEEPLFTIINGLNITDIEDTPSNWTLEDLGKK